MITFYKCYRDAPEIIQADKSALGTMPAAAFQYCEAMRTASSYGYHVFPPRDVHLNFDGKEVFFYEDGQWFPVKATNFGGEFSEQWNTMAPPEFEDLDPPFLTELFVPGLVQIWSGYFVATEPGWSINIRPVVNFDTRSSFSCFEGIVETDSFKPMPLFMNIKLNVTGREIFIPKYKPYFQVQPVQQTSYKFKGSKAVSVDMSDGDAFPWDSYENTVRVKNGMQFSTPGRYAVETRKNKPASDDS